MTFLHSLFLGLLQGLTEFLPISSSGHLVIFQNLFGLTEPMISFDVMLHLGTLVAVLLFFRRDIIAIISAIAGNTVPEGDTWSGGPREGRMFMLWVIVGTLPAAAAGLFLEEFFELAFESLPVVGADLLITGAVLAVSDRFRGPGKKAADLGPAGALIVGAAQALAILPGISRSGATICAALFLGLDRKEAARYSFLLSVPAIAGAAVLKAKDAFGPQFEMGLPVLGGTALACISGLVALQWLLAVLTRGRLIYFAAYCWLAAAGAFSLSFLL